MFHRPVRPLASNPNPWFRQSQVSWLLSGCLQDITLVRITILHEPKCIFNYSGTYRNVHVIRHKGARSCLLNNYERGTQNRNQTKGQEKWNSIRQYLIPWTQRKEKERHCTHFPTRKQHCLEKGLNFELGEACACSSMLQ